MTQLPCRSALLYGEVAVADAEGHSDFGALQNALSEGKGGFGYYLFDLLSLDGEDWRSRPLIDRKRRLEKLLQGARPEEPARSARPAIVPDGDRRQGIHVVAPFMRKHSWQQHRQFAEALARHMADEQPDLYVANMSKAKRRRKIFVDYLRNQRGSTAIAPFSTRAKAGATVALPVSWRGLARLKNAHPATIANELAWFRGAILGRAITRSARRCPSRRRGH